MISKPIHALILSTLVLLPLAALAQAYPSKPIRLVFPWAGGASSNDILGRGLAQHLTKELGQQLVVDNRPGATGNIGCEIAARAAADGYTLLLAPTGQLTVNPSVFPKLAYNPLTDLAPIARFAVIPYVLAAHPSVAATNMRELVALAKARPGQLNFGSSGNGSVPHLSGELLKIVAGIDMVHVPYKGGALAAIGVVSGEVQLYFAGVTSLVQFIKAGKLRGIAAITPGRLSLLPEVQTAKESGLPGFEVSVWLGMLAPARTPQPIIRRLYDGVVKTINDPDMKGFMARYGAQAALMDPAQFGAYMKSETAKWAKVVKTANVKAD